MRLFLALATALATPFARKQNTATPETPKANAPPANDVEWCSHSRHGAFPVRRKLTARSVSAHGHEFVVFQCPVPACGEFVAKVLGSPTGQDHILFRGHHFSPRRERPRQPAFRPIRAT